MGTDAEILRRRHKVRKYLVFAAMLMLFIGCMWLIFAPSEKDRRETEESSGFNAELPDPRGTGIEADKMSAYEQEDMRRRQEEKMRALAGFSSLAGRHVEEGMPESVDTTGGDSRHRRGDGSGGTDAFASSVSAYNDINAMLGSFYESPEEDPGKEALKAEVERLGQAAAQQSAGPSYEEQVALLEKSYELAARYMPAGGNAGTGNRQAEEPAAQDRREDAVPVGLVSAAVVSSLPQPVTDSVQFAGQLTAADAGFHTAVGGAGTRGTRNTIRACVHGDQTVSSGESVRIRLLEDMRVGRHVLPRNTLLAGEGRIQGERLDIRILQIEHGGTVVPVELTVLDSDGQTGIFIPGSMEADALREMAANMGQDLGTTISVTNQSAGDQLLSELGSGVIQGVSQYISRKMREEKVRLKSGYTLMLYQDNNQ